MITKRGIKLWPEGFEETFCTDDWRCRFKLTEGNQMNKQGISNLKMRQFSKELIL